MWKSWGLLQTADFSRVLGIPMWKKYAAKIFSKIRRFFGGGRGEPQGQPTGKEKGKKFRLIADDQG